MTTKFLVKLKFNIDRKGWRVEGAVVLDTRGGGIRFFPRGVVTLSKYLENEP